MDDTDAFILTDHEGGNPVSGVGGNVPLVAVDLRGQPRFPYS